MIDVVFLSPHSDPEADLGEPDAGGQCVYEHQLARTLTQQCNDVRVTTYCRQTGQRVKRSLINERYAIERIVAGPDGFLPKEELEGTLSEFVSKVLFNLPYLNPRP